MTEDELEKLKRELCDIQCGCNGKAGRCIIEDTICAALDELNERGYLTAQKEANDE